MLASPWLFPPLLSWHYFSFHVGSTGKEMTCERAGRKMEDRPLVPPQHHPLHPLSGQEEREWRRREKASSERVEAVRRAGVILAVAQKQTFSQTTTAAEFAQAHSVSQLVERFKQQGLAALLIASGRGRKPTSTSKHQERTLQKRQRDSACEKDQTATRSLALLRQILRTSGCSTRLVPRPSHPHVVLHRLRAPGASKRGRDRLRSRGVGKQRQIALACS